MPENIAIHVLRIAVPHLHELQVPVLDACRRREESEGSNQILFCDFTIHLLYEDFKLRNVLTANMCDLLQKCYRTHGGQHVQYQRMLEQMSIVERELKIKLFQTQAELDEHRKKELGIVDKPVIDPLAEPVYKVRSQKNTYVNSTEMFVGIDHL